jgi:hypothetical protein
MKSHKFGVWGLALGAVLLGAAACDDETEVVIPPPPPDPLVVTVTPADQTITAVGQTAQFVASVTGGEEGTVRTVTWTSSNTGVATVSATGLATAVANGTTTIIATSTADPTVQGAASLTVDDASSAPVTIAITSVTRGGTQFPVDRNNAFGQIDVTVDLDIPPGALVDRMEVLIDGTVLYSQSFATGAADVAAAEAELEAQAAALIVASINTATFDAATGDVPALFKNGPHALSARVIRPNGTVTATESITLVYNNENFINATFGSSGTAQTSEPAPRSLAPAGSLWHTGDITLTLIPVNFGSAEQAVASISATLATSGDGVTGVDGCVPDPDEDGLVDATDDPTVALDDGGDGEGDDFPECDPEVVAQTGATASPVTLTFPADEVMDDGGMLGVEDVFETTIASVTAGGQAGPDCINPDPNENPHNFFCETFFANPLRVDNLAPRVTQLSVQRPPNQYFGPNVFELDHDDGGTTAVDAPCDDLNEDGTIDNAPCARSVDYGVGGNTAVFMAGPLGEEIAVTPGGAELEETEDSEAYALAVVVTDKSGNSSTRWATDPDETGSDISVSTTRTEDDNDDFLQFFGWDATPPSIEIVNAPETEDVNPDEVTIPEFDLLPVDESESAGPSGFLDDPFSVKAERILPGATTCRDVEDAYDAVSCTTGDGFRVSDGIFDTPATAGQEGYFNFTIRLADAAGNTIEEDLVIWILEDITAPEVVGLDRLGAGAVEGGEDVDFAADLEDNVDLGSITPFLGFGGTYVNFPHAGGTDGVSVIGTFGPETLTGEHGGDITIANFLRHLDNASGNGGVPTNAGTDADEIMYHVRDMAGYQLRYMKSPWQTGANGFGDDGGVCGGQNCTVATEGISGVEGPDDPPFESLSDLNADGANPGFPNGGDTPAAFDFNWGSFRIQPFDAGDDVVCNSTEEDDCPTEAANTIDFLTVLQGPRGSFVSPLSAVWFVYEDPAVPGVFHFITTASSSVVDNTIEETRTYRYRGTWNAADLKVRPAGDPGYIYNVYAVGITDDGDVLVSTAVAITVEGDPE